MTTKQFFEELDTRIAKYGAGKRRERLPIEAHIHAGYLAEDLLRSRQIQLCEVGIDEHRHAKRFSGLQLFGHRHPRKIVD